MTALLLTYITITVTSAQRSLVFTPTKPRIYYITTNLINWYVLANQCKTGIKQLHYAQSTTGIN